MLDLHNVTVQYPDFQLGPISLSLKPGTRSALLGRNGAGKTTLLGAISGQIKAASGHLSFNDQVLNSSGLISLRDRVAHVRTQFTSLPWLTVSQHFDFLSKIYKSWSHKHALDLAETLELNLKAKTGTLSRGNSVKLGLCSAWGQRADFLLLDEPTAGLDPVARNVFLENLDQLLGSANAPHVMYVTHLLDELKVVRPEKLYWLEEGQLRTIDHDELKHMMLPSNSANNKEISHAS